MKKNLDYLELAIQIAKRSTCNIQVGAIIFDEHGVFSWGWNHSGAGFGMHAEDHAIHRANRKRLEGSTIMIVSIRRRKYICSLPCEQCAKKIYRAKFGFVNAQCSDGYRRKLPL